MKHARFNFSDFDLRTAVDQRVQLEDMKRWGAQITPPFTPIPDETKYKDPEPPLLAIYNFLKGCRP